MRNSHLAIILGIWLALAACSKPTQDKTTQDLKSVGSDVSAAAKDVAAAPAVKELGSDIKQGAKETGQTLKDEAKSAGAKTDAALNKVNEDATKKQ
jgi:hypothetical protein